MKEALRRIRLLEQLLAAAINEYIQECKDTCPDGHHIPVNFSKSDWEKPVEDRR